MRICNTGCNSSVNADPSAALPKANCSYWQVLPDPARLVLVLAVQEDAVPVVERAAAALSKTHCYYWQVLADSARLVLVLAVQEDAVPVVRIRIRIWNIADPQHWLQLIYDPLPCLKLIVPIGRSSQILPAWSSCWQSKKTQSLWWRGLPPPVRGRVWKLALHNQVPYGSGSADPWIPMRIRILLFSSKAFKTPQKIWFFKSCLAYYVLFEGTFTSFLKDKKS